MPNTFNAVVNVMYQNVIIILSSNIILVDLFRRVRVFVIFLLSKVAAAVSDLTASLHQHGRELKAAVHSVYLGRIRRHAPPAVCITCNAARSATTECCFALCDKIPQKMCRCCCWLWSWCCHCCRCVGKLVKVYQF